MSGHHVPAVADADPGLHLAADLAGVGGAVKQRRGDSEVAAVGGDDGPRDRPRQADRRTGAAERCDLVVAVEVLTAAIANGAGIVVEHCIERGNVVVAERLLVALECSGDLGDDVGQVDLHGVAHFLFALTVGVPAATTPASSSACAMRNGMSSRQGAAMICTPIGSGSSGTGTATTGRPTKEIGWV